MAGTRHLHTRRSLSVHLPSLLLSGVGITQFFCKVTSGAACNLGTILIVSQWLQTIDISSFTAVEARSPKVLLQGQSQGVGRTTLPPEALGENLFPASSASGGCRHSSAPGHMTSLAASVTTLPSLLSVVKPPSYKDTQDYI